MKYDYWYMYKQFKSRNTTTKKRSIIRIYVPFYSDREWIKNTQQNAHTSRKIRWVYPSQGNSNRGRTVTIKILPYMCSIIFLYIYEVVLFLTYLYCTVFMTVFYFYFIFAMNLRVIYVCYTGTLIGHNVYQSITNYQAVLLRNESNLTCQPW